MAKVLGAKKREGVCWFGRKSLEFTITIVPSVHPLEPSISRSNVLTSPLSPHLNDSLTESMKTDGRTDGLSS